MPYNGRNDQRGRGPQHKRPPMSRPHQRREPQSRQEPVSTDRLETGCESDYLNSLIGAKLELMVVLRQGDHIAGQLVWYDLACLKLAPSESLVSLSSSFHCLGLTVGIESAIMDGRCSAADGLVQFWKPDSRSTCLGICEGTLAGYSALDSATLRPASLG